MTRTPYEDLLAAVRERGVRKEDRTGTGTLSLFGWQMRFDLKQGFPLITTKKVHFKSLAHELLWFIRGEGNVSYLRENGVSIWDEWADERGELGPVYGVQWRSWPEPQGGTIDQLQGIIDEIKKKPFSRRLVVSAWNVADLPAMALQPCHALFQFWVAPPAVEGGRGKLSCQLYQRSGDVFLGVPFNLASYAMLTHMVAQVCDLDVGDFIHTLGDAHLYLNHLEQADLQLSRDSRPLPTLKLSPEPRQIDDFRFEHFTLEGYDPHPGIKAPVAV